MLPTEYLVHGVPLRVFTGSEQIQQQTRQLLSGFRVEMLPVTPRAPLEIRLAEKASPATIPRSALQKAKFLKEHGRKLIAPRAAHWYDFFVGDRELLAEFRDFGFALVDYGRGRAESYWYSRGVEQASMLPFLCRFLVTELLKREGLHVVHASAVEHEGFGVVICGPTGRGKTTCCIALVRAGFRFLSDDHPLLRHRDADFDLLPFITPFRVTAGTIALVPELRAGRVWPPVDHDQKSAFALDEIYDVPPGLSAKPKLILLPQIMDSDRSCLAPVSKSEALRAFLPCGMLVTDRAIARQQLSLFSEVVAQARVYRLLLGRDFLDLPRLLRPLLESPEIARSRTDRG